MKNREDTYVDSLKLLGDYWTLRIIDELRHGELRYCELQRAADNLNPASLTNQLRKLETNGLVTRREETLDKISVTYSLSRLGNSVLPVIDALNYFSTKLETT